MEARRLPGNSYSPDVLKLLARAFDEAWEEIAESYGTSQGAIAAARFMLASAVLAAANKQGANDCEALKKEALVNMASTYGTIQIEIQKVPSISCPISPDVC